MAEPIHPFFEMALSSLILCEDCGNNGARQRGLAGVLCDPCTVKLEKQLQEDKMYEYWHDAQLEQQWDGDEDRYL